MAPATPPPGLRRRTNAADSQSKHAETVDARQKPPGAPEPAVPSNLPKIAILALILIRLISALVIPIADCDETFNYWDPTHFLAYGRGLQTWEYSPVYAIRSWTYVGIHAVVGRVFGVLTGGMLGKIATFYFTRAALALFAASCEIHLARSVAVVVGQTAAIRLLVVLMTSAGMFFAAPTHLPSTFAMSFVTLSLSLSLHQPTGSRILKSTLSFATAALLGWPFSAALAVPYALELLVRRPAFILDLLRSAALSALIVLLPLFVIDSYFYRIPVLVPLRIVLYNVFGGDLGPDLYGTESWTYYLLNLSLNFNVIFPIALSSLILVPIANLIEGKAPNATWKLAWFHLWLAIFSAQPHKEERFMFVVYPVLCFDAVLGLGAIEGVAKRVVERAAKWLVFGVMLGSAAISAIRIAGIVAFYSAPMRIYGGLEASIQLDLTGGLVTPRQGKGSIAVCVGKEWHRFPSSHFLSDEPRVDLKFVRSSFGGLLPKPFSEAGDGTHAIPTGMNNENRMEEDRFVAIGDCDYVVDLLLPRAPVDPLDTDFEKHGFERVRCERFLDKDRTSLLGRIGWVPGIRREWGEYCLLRQRMN